MLQPWISDADVLDIFAGSGALGLELVSRGGRSAVFIENSRSALSALTKNIEAFSLRAKKQGIAIPKLKVLAADVHVELAKLAESSIDILWADPPYQLVKDFLKLIESSQLSFLRQDGIFALECSSEDLEFVEAFSKVLGMAPLKQRQYGVTLITMWQKEPTSV